MRLYPFDFYALTIKEKPRTGATVRGLAQRSGSGAPIVHNLLKISNNEGN